MVELKSSKLKTRVRFPSPAPSQETKDLIGLKNSIAQKGEKNSQFGTIWITNGIKPIKIKKDDVIPEGYIRGKKFIKALDEKSFEEFNKKVYND